MVNFQVKPLSEALGAELIGIDISKPISRGIIKKIKEAWYKHLVILFRGTELSPKQQQAFAANFGNIPLRPKNVSTKEEKKIGKSFMLVSNVRKNGKPIGSLPDGEMMFHSDRSYCENPLKATLLYAIEIPSRGGNTLFSNGYKAAETLPKKIITKLNGKKALHIYDYSSQIKVNDVYDKTQHLNFAHPVFRKHPETERSALFVNELMTEEIIDITKNESQKLLESLFAHQRNKKFIYEHRWKPGDLIMWDNRCCNHARTDFPADERRMLRRVTVEEEFPVLPGDPLCQ